MEAISGAGVESSVDYYGAWALPGTCELVFDVAVGDGREIAFRDQGDG